MKNSGICIATLLGGMLIGSALTMLLTPKSGPEMRKQIRDMLNDELARVKDKADKVRAEVQEEMEELRCRCDD